MKKFILKSLLFFTIPIILFIAGLLMPSSKKAQDYYLFSKTEKDSLLGNVGSKRIILLGGSNVVFGFNSEIVKETLDFNPINGGLTATVGLIYMMDNVLPFVKKGDVVILIPEYQHFIGNFAYGGEDLVRLIFEVELTGLKNLRREQWINIAKKSPNYIVSKFNPVQYFGGAMKPQYQRNIFNEFGDSKKHWSMDPQSFPNSDSFSNEINLKVISEILDFSGKVQNKGATLYVSYPCFESTSFDKNKLQIFAIEKELKKHDLNFLGSAERYKFNDSLMFDTPYHLIKTGVDRRTKYLVEDILKSGGVENPISN